MDEVIGYGNAECIRNPHGRSGLQPYTIRQTYSYEMLEINGAKFYRLQPSKMSDWQECSPGAFKTFFKELNGSDIDE